MTKLLPIFLLAGCSNASLPDSNTLATTDQTGAEVDVVVGDHEAKVTSQQRVAIVDWNDTGAAVDIGDRTIVFAVPGADGQWLPQDDAALVAYAPMLGAAEHAMLDAGVDLPWRDGIHPQAAATCETWSTWVWYSGQCTACQEAVDNLHGTYGGSWSNTSESCSSNLGYTSCSQTWCHSGGEEMLLE